MTYYRRLPKFDYLSPKSVGEVVALLGEHKGDARLLGGGTIAIHQMKERVNVKPFAIGLKGVAELKDIVFQAGAGLSIGSMAYLQQIADSPDVRANAPLLGVVCGAIGTPQIRNMGTLGGNVAIRFSTSESLPALIALKAEARLVDARGERTVAVEDLYKEMKGPDLLTGLRIPVPAAGLRVGYRKFAVREHFDYATVAAAVAMDMDGTTCRDVTIGLGGVTLPTMRAKAAEELLRGREVTAELVGRAAETAADGGHTGADIMFSAEYKKKVLKVMVERAINEALTREP